MGYTRSWTPATIPYRNNLSAWITICKDIHNEMINAGLVQTADTGQLADFDAVGTLPADGAFQGYRMYAFADALAATCPILIRLDFGCGTEGNTTSSSAWQRTRTLRIKITVGKTSDGAGNITALSVNTTWECPQTLSGSGSVTSELTSPGTSVICYNAAVGFFGFFYGLGSRNKPNAYDGGSGLDNPGCYHGCTLGIMIQRDIDANGTPIDSGFSLWQQDESGTWSSVGWASQSVFTANCARTTYIPKTGTACISAFTSAARPGDTKGTPIGGVPQIHPVYIITPEVKRTQSIVTYINADISVGTQFQLEVKPGTVRNFIALGNENRLAPDPFAGYLCSFAMLFE